MKVCVFIPTWNCRQEVLGVLEQIPPAFGRNCAEVFVLDNASTDGTTDAVCSHWRHGFSFPVSVYRNRTNLGYGGTQKVAYAHALRQGYDVILILHGDGQYPAPRLPALLEAVADPKVGMAYGSRLLPSGDIDETPPLRRWAIRGLSCLQNVFAGQWITEWYSGFRALRCDALRRVPFQACSSDYYLDVQILLLMRLAGLRIGEIAVAKKYEGNHSPINVVGFGCQVLTRLLHYPLARLGLPASRLYRVEHWDELRQIAVPEPLHVAALPPAHAA